jgi:phage-related protein
MADDSEDLVSQVRIEGTDEATKQLQDLGDKGGAAFDKLAQHAKDASSSISKSTSDIEKNAGDANKAVGQVGNADAGKSAAQTVQGLDNISSSMEKLSRTAIKVGKDLSQFVTRVAGLATAAAAAATGIGVLATNVAKSQQTQTSAFEDTNKAQQQLVQTNLNSTQASIQFASQQRQLNLQFAQGKITYDQYSDTLQQNRQNYNEQIRVTAQLEAAQESARLETERLQKQLADRKVYTDLIDTYGGPLTGALTNLGNTLATLKTQFLNAFGPSIANAVNLVTSTLQTSGTSINSFFDGLAQKFDAFIQNNGPAIQQALTSIGAGITAVFNGIIDALPTLLNFFNNQLVPAFKAAAVAADSIVQAFNFLFGTNFSTGAGVIIAAITSLTGGFKLLHGVIALVIEGATVISSVLLEIGIAASPLSIIFLGIVAAIILLNTNWTAFGQNALNIWNAFTGAISSGGDAIKAVFASIGTAISDAFTAAINAVVDAWNGTIAFFQSLPDTIGGIFDSVTDAIKNAFISAFNAISTFVTGWVQTIKGYLQPIIDAIGKIMGFLSGTSGDVSSDQPAFAGGGKVNGAGTSTSDSILAWLSNNEFVMRAKAVRKYGVSFMRAVNAGSLDLSSLGRYAVGGLVNALTPAATFGASTALPAATAAHGFGVLNLAIGDDTFRGLIIPDEDTANSLIRFTNKERVKSGGRRPSWDSPRR